MGDPSGMFGKGETDWPQLDGKWEWEYLRDIFLNLLSEIDNGLANAVNVAAIRPLHDGHAYSPKELKELRSILRLKGAQSDIALQFETDAFAAYIGMRIRSERKLTSKARIKDIKSRFLNHM